MFELDRNTIPLRLAEIIEKDIKEGKWTDQMPGYRVLSEHYGVGRVTCEAAFDLLERKKVLAPAEPRKTRKIINPNRGISLPERGKTRRLLTVTDDKHQSSSSDRLLRMVQDYWVRNQGTVHNVSADLSRFKRPHNRLEKWIKQEHADCIMLLVPPELWTGAAEASGLPYHILGGTWPKATEPPSGSGFEVIHNHELVLERLRALGHHRILSPTVLSRKRLRRATITAYERVFGEEFSEAEREDWVPMFRESSPDIWQSYWHRYLTERRPTAVIVENSYELLSLYGYCTDHGIRIPEDLSVISISNEPELNWVHPLPLRMNYPSEKAVRHFQNWVRSDFSKRFFKFFTMNWVEGASIGPPNKRRTK